MIRQLRLKVAALLTDVEGCPCEVWPYQPDDLTGVPCVVVGRPTITVNVQHHSVELPVRVLGRRDGTEDAQSELDELTSWVARHLAGPDLAVTRITPDAHAVADLTYPAYEVATACGVTYC